MTQSSANESLLVPVANPETVDRLMDTANDIALSRDIPITLVHVVEVPPQIPLSEGDEILSDEGTEAELLEYAEERAHKRDISTDTRLRYARDTATGIIGAVSDYNSSAMLIGWRGRPRRRDIVLGSFLDRVLGEAPCDVFVKRIRMPTSTVESILVPVAGGPHDELAAALAANIASVHDAVIELLHIQETNTVMQESEQEILDSRKEHIQTISDVSVKTRFIKSEHVAGTITDETGDHDLAILGATRDPFLRRKLVGSVAQGVGRSSACSVIVTRKFVEE